MLRIVRYVLTHLIRYVLTLLILPLYTILFIRTKTRKPKSDIQTFTQTIPKIDRNIHIDSIDVIKIDSETNILKNEILVGITLIGKVSNINNTLLGYYFKSIHFIDTIDNQQKHITVEIIPKLTSIHLTVLKTKLRHSKVKYNYSPNNFTFEFYLEKPIQISGFGDHKIDIKCAQKNETINIVRYK